MRQGYVWKRCTDCGRKVDEKRCGCGSRRWSWAFRVDVAPPGAERRQRTRAGFGTQAEALEALAELQGDLADGVRVEPSKMTLGEYLPLWLEGADLRPSTKAGYGGHIRNHIVPELGEWRLQDLDTLTVKKFYGSLDLAPRTVHRVHTTLQSALRDAVEDGLISRNPAERAHSEPKSTGDDLQSWTADELARFLRSIDGDRWAPMFRLLALTGMRRAEVAGLKWSAVDLQTQTITVRWTRTRAKGGVVEGPPKTTRGRRSIDIDETTTESLIELMASQMAEAAEWGDAYSEDDWVFCHEDGSPIEPSGISSRFRRRSKAAGLRPIPLHGLRHTHATLMLASGVPGHVVSRRLGHASEAFTLSRYAHVLPQQGADAAAKVAALVDGVS